MLSNTIAKNIVNSMFSMTMHKMQTPFQKLNQNNIHNKKYINRNVRTLKDRLNPFQCCKVETILEIYQKVKNNGNENCVTEMLGIGLNTTPLSLLIKETMK